MRMLDFQRLKIMALKQMPSLEDLFLVTEFKTTRADSECLTAYATLVAKDTPLVMFNEKFMAGLAEKEQAAVCIHELLHIVFGHLHTHTGTDGQVANVMMDVLINRSINDLPKGAITHLNIAHHIFGDLLKIDAKTRNEFAPLIAKLHEKSYIQHHPWPSTLQPAWDLHLTQLIDYFCICRDFLRQKFGIELDTAKISTIDIPGPPGILDSLSDEMVEKILDKLKHGGGDYGSDTWQLARDLEQTLNYRRAVPWSEVLKDALSESAHGKMGITPSWRRPSRRFGPLSSGLKHLGINIVVIVDTSGSVSGKRLTEVGEELSGLVDLGLVTGGFPVIYGDVGEAGIQHFDGTLDPMQCKGGGGTNMNPLIKSALTKFGPDVTIMVFTDGEIPPFDYSIVVDPEKLVWLVSNVYGNRWKSYMQEQPGRVIDVSVDKR